MPSILTRPSGGGAGGGSISVSAYSDAGLTTPITTANYGDTIYINAVASGLTPTQYSFSLTNGTKSETFNQAGATLTYVVEQFGSVAVAASARDGSTGVSVSATSTLTVGVVKNACSFDGVNDVVEGTIVYDGRFIDHSFSFWAKWNVAPTGAQNSAFLSIELFGSNPCFGLTYTAYGGGRYQIISYPLNTANSYVSGIIAADTDYHFYTVTYDYSATTIKVYRDGLLIITQTTWNYQEQWGSLIFAYNRNYPFQGLSRGNITMKDFRIHDSELDLATIQAMYADDTLMSGSEVQWIPFYEPIGTTTGNITDIIADRKMNLNNMTSPYGIVAP